MWMGVRRPFIMRMTIGRPQLQFGDVQTMGHLVRGCPVDASRFAP